MIFSLIQDFADVLSALPREHPRHRILTLLDEAMRRDIHFIDRHPTTLFQCLWNSCWWYDCPQAEKSEVRSPANLQQLMTAWRECKELATPQHCWARSLRPPARALGGMLVFKVDLPSLDSHLPLTVRYSPDDRHIISSQQPVQGPRRLSVVDRASGLERCTINESFPYAIGPDCRKVAMRGDGDDIRIWDLHTGQPIGSLHGHTSRVSALAFSPDGTQIASCSDDKTIRLWNAVTLAESARHGGHDGNIRHAEYSPDGRRLLLHAEHAGEALVWNAANGTPLFSIRSSQEFRVAKASFAVKGERIVAFGRNGRGDRLAQIHDAETGALLAAFPEPMYYCFSEDRRLWATAPRDGTLRLVDLTDGREVACFQADPKWMVPYLFSPDGSRIACESTGTFHLLDATNGRKIASMLLHDGSIHSMAFTRDGKQIVTASPDDRSIKVWDLTHPEALSASPSEERRVHAIALTAAGEFLVHVSRSVEVLEASTAQRARVLANDPKGLHSRAISEHGERVFAIDSTSRAHIWESGNGREVASFDFVSGQPAMVEISPDGRWLAVADRDGQVVLFDATSGDRLGVLVADGAPPSCMAFDAAGTLLALGAMSFQGAIAVKQSEVVRIWSLPPISKRRSAAPRELRTRGIGTTRLAFSPDGTLLAAARVTDVLQVWETADWTPRIQIPVNRLVVGMTFSPDARKLVTQSVVTTREDYRLPDDVNGFLGEAGIIEVWDVLSGTLLEKLNGRGDLESIAERRSPSRFRAWSNDEETVVERQIDHGPIAYFPARFTQLVMSQSPAVVAGRAGSDFHAFEVEGTITSERGTNE